MSEITRVGADLAKRVIQVHGVDTSGKLVTNRALSRDKFIAWCAQLPAGCLVAMEASSSAHHWARKLVALGLDARIIAAHLVAPYRLQGKGGKNDANDAAAICEAASRPQLHFVPIKSVEQQSMLCVHRLREGLKTDRTACVNRIRDLEVPVKGLARVTDLAHAAASERGDSMTQRRHLLLAAGGALAWPYLAIAQPSGRTYRLGVIETTSRAEPYFVAFVQRLAELGFVEGRNLVIEFPLSPGRTGRLPALAAELARLNCDLFFAPGSESNLLTVKQATRDTPIIIVANDYDPVATGHIANMARPGGRITGVSMLQTERPAKRLGVLRELLPKVRRVGVLADASTSGQLKVTQEAAALLGIELLVHQFISAPYDFPAAFAALARSKAEALLALASGFFVVGRRQIPELALQHHLPSVFNNYLWAESGGLLSYGPDFSQAYRRAAEQVAKVFNGARAGELPLEQPNAVELVVNFKTAKALGLAVPQAVLLRTDRVIE